MKKSLLILLGTLLAGLFSGSNLFAQDRLTCSSEDGGRHYCEADTRGGVRMINQRSGSPCIQGRTWGWDRKGVWVDQGCRADFALGRQGGQGGGQGGGYYRPGSGRPQQSYNQRKEIITCSSDNGKRNWCPADIQYGVRLVKQRSGSPCTQGRTWGTQPGSVWVDRGCRADFEVVVPR